ncbi:Acylamino-acid-releasing enzyme [Orchesella cincta]|uniref:acylaminoacyl-peptidase n=1 Tax=Orchesella cincta TaxID=48709 RepID=A0A1D2NEU9_ORCCI|nr:Acylamino-acid-releasing enzyme [Orchesella cincta]
MAEVDEVVESWINILKIPTLSQAYIREDDNFLNVATTWSVNDAAKKENLSFARTFSVLKNSVGSGTPVVSTPGSVTINEKLSVASRTGQKRAVIVEKASDGDTNSKTEYLQIWSDSTLLKTYNLGELDLHQAVYTSNGWGITMTWSHSENKLAYLAEKKVPKAKSFYTSAAKAKSKAEIEKDTEKEVALGEEFEYKQTWGEQLTGKYFSVIVVVDLDVDEFNVLPLPETHFPTDIQWVGDSHIVGTSYPLPIWRLGLIYCSNRESIIFSVQADGENFQTITETGKACRSPRVRSDGGFLVWQQRNVDGAHDRARSINGIALNQGQPSGQPRVIYESAPQNGMPVFQDFSRNCWSTDGNTLFVVTPNEGTSICLAITVGLPVQVRKIEQVDALLGITNDYLLVSSSTTITSPQLQLLRIAQNYQVVEISQSVSPIDFPTLKELVYGEASPPSIFHGPAIASVPPNSVPLICYPHGGPHSCFVDTFSNDTILFLKLGFAVLRLNYVGSIGGTRDTADDLLGKIGDRDVKDCQAMVEKVLSSNASLNPEQVVVFGGSHGGFLSCHLSSAYPDVYKAIAVRNPVTDLATLVGTSDITDWTYAEAGVNFPGPPVQTLIPIARDLVDAEKYIKASPIHNADKVKGATLLLLGSEDLRVPSQQGLGYYRALKAYGKVAEVRMYPDSHPLTKAAVRLDTIIHAALWFQQYIR